MARQPKTVHQMVHRARQAAVIRQHMAPKAPPAGDLATLIHSMASNPHMPLEAAMAHLRANAGPMPAHLPGQLPSHHPIDQGTQGAAGPAGPVPAAMPAPHTPDRYNPAAVAYATKMLAKYGVQVNPGEDATLLWRNLSSANAAEQKASASQMAAARLRALLAQNYDPNAGAPAYQPYVAPGGPVPGLTPIAGNGGMY